MARWVRSCCWMAVHWATSAARAWAASCGRARHRQVDALFELAAGVSAAGLGVHGHQVYPLLQIHARICRLRNSLIGQSSWAEIPADQGRAVGLVDHRQVALVGLQLLQAHALAAHAAPRDGQIGRRLQGLLLADEAAPLGRPARRCAARQPDTGPRGLEQLGLAPGGLQQGE